MNGFVSLHPEVARYARMKNRDNMRMDFKRLSKETLKLPPESRERLTRKLLNSLDQDHEPIAENEQLWVREAERIS